MTDYVLAQFCSEQGETLDAPINLPLNISTNNLQLICNALLKHEEDPVPFAFFVNDQEVVGSLEQSVTSLKGLVNTEQVVDIIYQPQALFRVKAVTRCTSSIPGHGDPVISASFSPDGASLVSGSGDKSVRFWDVSTETPHKTCNAHAHWVLCVTWSPDGRLVASGCKLGEICVWNAHTAELECAMFKQHKRWITQLCWQPLHLCTDGVCRQLVSASKDGDLRVWDVQRAVCLFVLSGHTDSVTCARWSGANHIYSGSHDRTVKLWSACDGSLIRTLTGHAHWINTLALSTDYILRTGAYEPGGTGSNLAQSADCTGESLHTKAKRRYEAFMQSYECGERLISGSDDFTMFLWNPKHNKHLARLTGHQQLINDVKFSPDGRIVASASFDKSIRLWNGKTGRFIATLRGHVQAVYVLSWSADSRLLVSGGADSTVKVWSVRAKKLSVDLPGHADEVFTVDWSPDGQRVVSGGKDRVLRIWRQ